MRSASVYTNNYRAAIKKKEKRIQKKTAAFAASVDIGVAK